MKKFLPVLLAAFAFVVFLVLNRPEQPAAVVVAARDLPAGTTLSAADLAIRELPKSLAPEQAIADPADLVGQRLRVPRSAGDTVLPGHLGGEALELQPNERAVAVSVSDASGLAGLLKPGDQVGVTAILGSQQAIYSKTTVEGVRVLWISPSFQRAEVPASQATPEPGGLSLGNSSPVSSAAAAPKGIIILAVPTDLQTISYTWIGANVPPEQRKVSAIELLAALQAQGAQLSLYLLPENPTTFQTGGLPLSSLVITPGPTITPTPTGMPGSTPPILTPQPTTSGGQ